MRTLKRPKFSYLFLITMLKNLKRKKFLNCKLSFYLYLIEFYSLFIYLYAPFYLWIYPKSIILSYFSISYYVVECIYFIFLLMCLYAIFSLDIFYAYERSILYSSYQIQIPFFMIVFILLLVIWRMFSMICYMFMFFYIIF